MKHLFIFIIIIIGFYVIKFLKFDETNIFENDKIKINKINCNKIQVNILEDLKKGDEIILNGNQ